MGEFLCLPHCFKHCSFAYGSSTYLLLPIFLKGGDYHAGKQLVAQLTSTTGMHLL